MSKKQSSTPHDALFKLFLRQPETARDFLAFHLPAPIHALCDMKTLKLESSSFIDDDLRESYSDVLWSVKTEQGPGYIYCLIEHRSTSNKLIAFRMMRYAIAACKITWMPDTKRCRWWCHCCFTTVLKAPIPIRCVGLIVSPIPTWQGSFMPLHFR